MTTDAQSKLFNSPLETGVRSVVLLNTAYPQGFDLTQLTWLDHLVVHTSDIAGPESLHPNIPQRNGELLVRRSLVEEGLSLMHRMHLIDMRFTDRGILYVACDEAAPFVNLIRSNYGRDLKSRADWLIQYLTEHGFDHLHEIVSTKIGRWAIEFRSEVHSARFL